MRLFYGLGDDPMDSEVGNTEVSGGSCVSSCSLGSPTYVPQCLLSD